MLSRWICFAAAAAACVALLASCLLLTSPPGAIFDDSQQKADAQMQRIADAVKDRDSTALKNLFSQRARHEATDLDGGLKRFLSAFPSGPMTWKSLGPNSATHTEFLKETEVLFSLYKVSAGGKDYFLFFVDYTVNQVDDPTNVGLYALGFTPYTTETQTASGEKKPFFAWEGSFQVDPPQVSGDPGVYVPAS